MVELMKFLGQGYWEMFVQSYGAAGNYKSACTSRTDRCRASTQNEAAGELAEP